MSAVKSLSKLFPTRSSFVVFVLYIVLFSNHGILVTASQNSSNKYEYNVVTVVLLTEVIKLVASIGLYLKDEKLESLIKEIYDNKNVLVLYLVPAFLYCLYNNLSYYNLLAFDPTTYNLLLQFRIFITATLFQLIFKKQLSKKQWISLLILTAGCMMKQINFGTGSLEPLSANGKLYGLNLFHMSTVFLLVQMVCSCFAGVYNEYLLKNDGADVNIYVQNVFMYLDSIFCNVLVLLMQGTLHEAFTPDSLSKVFHVGVVVIMVNNATVGIITSFFLKQLNSILKTFASALEVVLTAILAYILFQIPIYLNTVLSIVTVLFAVYLYTLNPVRGQEQEQSRSRSESTKEEQEELLMDEVLVKG